jgi:hypothetical protein
VILAPLDFIPLWLLFLAACVLSGFAFECGYRFGRWRHTLAGPEKEAPVGAMVGSILGLLAFLLAFTFGMAGSRFDARRQAVLDEANAIGTAYLRTRILPEPQRSETAVLLREYVDVRIRGVEEGKVAEALSRSEELQQSLWSRAVEASKNKESVPGMPGLFLQSLNEMIDVNAKRVQVGLHNRIPVSIWIGLLALALLSMAALGYQSGLTATRRSPATLAIVLAFAGVLYLIADLDRPDQGFLRVSQQALIDVQKSMHAARP